jgi:hypothetical protein
MARRHRWFGSGAPRDRFPDQIQRLAAAQAAPVDFATDNAADDTAEDRAEGTITAAGNFVAGKGADACTDNEAGSAVIALAIIATVIAAPHAVTAADAAGFVVTAAIVIDPATTATITTVTVVQGRHGRGRGRRFNQGACRSERGGCNFDSGGWSGDCCQRTCGDTKGDPVHLKSPHS